MKKLLQLTLLLAFCCHYAQESVSMPKDTSPEIVTTSNQENSSSKTHLELIFNDLIQKKAFTSGKILILNTYKNLKDFNFKNKSYTFQVTDKSGFNNNATNNIIFWRMDVEENKAFYELYVKNPETTNTKYSYHLELVRGKWLIQQQ